MEKVLSGKPVAERIKAFIKEQVQTLRLTPRMLLVQLEGDSASDYYVQNIIRNGARLGIAVESRKLPTETDQTELLNLIASANSDPDLHGIMIQKPLPSHIDEALIGSAIDPDKDLDSLNPVNLGRIMMDMNGLTPATPTAVYALLRFYGIPTRGKHVVIIGRSAVVGKPLANMLLWKKPFADASVSVVHSRSAQLQELSRQADILVAALGKAGFVNAGMIKENSVLIDVGINEVPGPEGKPVYVGDIDYNSCYDKAIAITPVPGGIGTVTSALLFVNLLRACMGLKKDNKSIDDFLGLIFNEIHND